MSKRMNPPRQRARKENLEAYKCKQLVEEKTRAEN